MEVRSTKYERRVRSNEDDDEERERGVLRHASYTRFDSQYLGDFYSDSGKPPLVVVAVVAAVSRLGDFYSDSGKPPLVVVAVVAAVSRLS
jgi:hypothetical protein